VSGKWPFENRTVRYSDNYCIWILTVCSFTKWVILGSLLNMIEYWRAKYWFSEESTFGSWMTSVPQPKEKKGWPQYRMFHTLGRKLIIIGIFQIQVMLKEFNTWVISVHCKNCSYWRAHICLEASYKVGSALSFCLKGPCYRTDNQIL
jgi:hypothetical protein